jgi:hypothetical protein
LRGKKKTFTSENIHSLLNKYFSTILGKNKKPLVQVVPQRTWYKPEYRGINGSFRDFTESADKKASAMNSGFCSIQSLMAAALVVEHSMSPPDVIELFGKIDQETLLVYMAESLSVIVTLIECFK